MTVNHWDHVMRRSAGTSAQRHLLELACPLPADTASSEAVARRVGQFLREIRSQAEPVSGFDVLQTLAITTAVTSTIADAKGRNGVDTMVEPPDVAAASAPVADGRARGPSARLV